MQGRQPWNDFLLAGEDSCKRQEWWLQHYDFDLKAFVYAFLERSADSPTGEFISEETAFSPKKNDQMFYDEYTILLNKLSKLTHNATPNIGEFSSNLIAAITAGYMPNIYKVNANQPGSADWGLIEEGTAVSVATLAEGIRCWWPSIISWTLMTGSFHFIKDWPAVWMPVHRFGLTEDGNALPLSIENIWFRSLQTTEQGRNARWHMESAHICSPMRHPIKSTDYPSKMFMWSDVPSSYPVPMGDCVDGTRSPAEVHNRMVKEAQKSGYTGAILLAGARSTGNASSPLALPLGE